MEIVLNSGDLPAAAGGAAGAGGKAPELPVAPPRNVDFGAKRRPSSELSEPATASKPRRSLAFLEEIRARRSGIKRVVGEHDMSHVLPLEFAQHPL